MYWLRISITPPSNTKNNLEGSSQTAGLFTPSFSKSGPPVQTSPCLLKTAVAMVSTLNVTMEGNIIFDDHAQRSFVTQDLATKLNLQPYGKDNICLASFGLKSSTHRNLDMGIVEMHTLSGDKTPISVLVVPRIALPIQNSIHVTHAPAPHNGNKTGSSSYR